jgi:hypothetical protein
MRGEYRKNWLNELRLAGDVSTGSFEGLYKNLFMSLLKVYTRPWIPVLTFSEVLVRTLKDAENHGEGKSINAFVALLEKTEKNEVFLKYHASTPNETSKLLGKPVNYNLNGLGYLGFSF